MNTQIPIYYYPRPHRPAVWPRIAVIAAILLTLALCAPRPRLGAAKAERADVPERVAVRVVGVPPVEMMER